MPLTCDCGYDYDYLYVPDKNYSILETKKRKRCVSCKSLIDLGAIVLALACERYAKSEVEEKIYGEGCDVPMATKYYCEQCADLFFSLTELGFCIDLDDDLRELAKEYNTVYIQGK